MLWKRPDETAARAVATLAGAAGAERVKAARVSAHRLVRTMMINSRVLCDHAADGDTNKLRALLMDYAPRGDLGSAIAKLPFPSRRMSLWGSGQA